MRKPTKQEIEKITKKFKDLPEKYLNRYVFWRGFYDINFFINYFLPHYKTDKKTGQKIKDAKFHKELREKLQANKDLVIVVSRDHAKTTNGFFVMMHNIVYKKEKSILLIMSEGLGVETIGKIRDELEKNSKINYIFGRLVPNRTREEANKKRTKRQLDFLNGVSIETVGMGGTTRGKRPTLIYVDDPQENKDIQNPLTTEKFNNWFFSSVYNTLDPSGRCIVVGTILGNLCFVNLLLNEDRGFDKIRYDAIKDPIYETIDGRKQLVGGEPLRPEKRSIKALNKRMLTIGWDNFQQEYMNIPYNLNGRPVFTLEKIRELYEPRYEVDSAYDGLKIYNKDCNYCYWGIDTADGGIGGDYTTITIRDSNLNLVASYKGYIISKHTIELINHILDTYNFSGLIAIEKNRPQVIELAKDERWSNMLYRTETIDKITNQQEYKYGFHTSEQSKKNIIDNAHNNLISGKRTESDDRTKEELMNFYYNENGKASAISPYHDDLVMSDIICQYIVGGQTRIEFG